MSLPTPRILPTHLHAFNPSTAAGHPSPATSTIRLLGQITNLRGDNATLESCGGSTVTLVLNRDSHLSLNTYYEIVGKVVQLDGSQGLGVRVLGYTEWLTGAEGGKVDMKAYEAVVEATHRFKEIFYEGGEEGTAGAGY